MIACALYAPSLGYDLLWDDPALLGVVEERLRAGGLQALLTTPFHLSPSEPLGYYRPVVLLSLWLDTRAAAVLPWTPHATNILLHAVNAALAYLLFAVLLPSRTAAGWGAVFFALHPIHTESVAFVSGRTDLLAALFTLVTALTWARERRRESSPRPLLVASAGVTLALGCLSKEVAFALPAVLAASELASPSPPTGRRLRRALPWVVAGIAALGAVLALRAAIPGVGWDRGSIVALQGAAARWSTYLRLLLAPWPLSAYYDASQVTASGVNVTAAMGVLVLCAATAGPALARVGLVGLAWIVGFLLPGALFMRPGTSIVLAERLLYLPSVGFCLVAGTMVFRLGRLRGVRWMAAVAGAVAASGMVWGTLTRMPVWKDEVSLFKDAAEKSDAGLAWNNLGLAYAARDRLSEAMAAYHQALRRNPYDARALNNLGIALAEAGRWTEAQTSFERALQIFPHYADAHSNLGSVLERFGRRDEAVAHYREALKLRPGHPLATANLREALSAGGGAQHAPTPEGTLLPHPDKAPGH